MAGQRHGRDFAALDFHFAGKQVGEAHMLNDPRQAIGVVIPVILHGHQDVLVGNPGEGRHFLVEDRDRNPHAHRQRHAIPGEGQAAQIARFHALEIAAHHERARAAEGEPFLGALR